MKKLTKLLLLSMLCVLMSKTAFAYQFPNSFWPIDNAFLAAKNSGDLSGITTFGMQEYEMLKNEPANDTTYSCIASRLLDVAESYEKLGMYDNSRDAFIKYIPYAQYKNWTDGVIIANAKIKQFESILDVYTPSSDSQCFFGAKNEPGKGVLFGLPMDSTTRPELANESMILVYSHYGDSVEWWVENTLKEAQSTNKSVEIAVNLTNEASDIATIKSGSYSYFEELGKIIGSYSSVPVYFRFAAEVNVWSNMPAALDYIQVFQNVSSIIRSYANNAAIVYSICPASNWGISYNDFYPGDEFVDWIGVSLYMQKYFLGRNDWSENESFNRICFMTGDSADPVLMLKDIVADYGGRKPIMLAESGASHYVKTIGEDCTDWAVEHLQQMMHNVPMVYPQIKLIAYFDAKYSGDICDFSLMDSEILRNQFIFMSQNPCFIQNYNYSTDSVAYKKATDTIYAANTLDISSYVHLFGDTAISVNYFIDGAWVAGSSQLPYTQRIDTSQLSGGNHTLKVAASVFGNEKIEKTYTLVVSKENPISVWLNGSEIVFPDQAPIIVDGRTLVPMRSIFEALGAAVTWMDNTRTILGNKDDLEISLAIDSTDMTVKNSGSVSNVTLDVPAKIYNDRTLVPIRAISEAFNCNVEWNGEYRQVIITK